MLLLSLLVSSPSFWSRTRKWPLPVWPNTLSLHFNQTTYFCLRLQLCVFAFSVSACEAIETHETRSHTSLRNSPVLTQLPPKHPAQPALQAVSVHTVTEHLFKSEHSTQAQNAHDCNVWKLCLKLKKIWAPKMHLLDANMHVRSGDVRKWGV